MATIGGSYDPQVTSDEFATRMKTRCPLMVLIRPADDPLACSTTRLMMSIKCLDVWRSLCCVLFSWVKGVRLTVDCGVDECPALYSSLHHVA